MARIKKYAPEQKLSSFQTFILDENSNSDYFRITEFKDTFTGGKNGFLIEGSQYLKESTEIKIEILDVEGNPVYFEPGNGIPEYYEGISKLIAVYIYNDTPIGLGKITVLGELKKYQEDGVTRDVPDQWKGSYNVKWEKTFQINKTLSNEDKVRFYRRPEVVIDEIVKPIFSGNPPSVTQTGSVDGIPLVPLAGSNLSDFILPTSYRLKVNSGNKWTGSVEGEKITFDNITYSPTIEEIVNETEIVVSPPYVENNIVTSFTNEDYSVEFPYIEGVSDLATALTGSFAKISITNMKTFVGDAARVKVFRRSQSNLTDFEFVQEIQLESNELLRDITTFAKKEEPYGLFSQTVIDDYWVTSSNDFDVTFNQNFLYNSAKLDSTPGNYFFTSESFSIQSGVEYTLDLNVRKETTDPNAYVKVFLSGSNNGKGVTQQIANIPSSTFVLQKTNFSENILANNFDNAKLYFEASGSDWYVNNVSLKASQETSFSPDEITFIQQVPKTLVTETFDYRFEFYDINNNYIPIFVEDTKTFTGGNTNLFKKSIELNPDNLYFSFDSASNPANAVPPLTIAIDVDTTLVTGSITYTSGAYDFFGNLLSSSQYVGGIYPGYLTDWDVDSGRQPFLRVQDFTGSRDDISVQFIRYTGAIEGVSDTFVISRVEDGKGGVSFEIVPFRGVQIKNKESKTLEIQAIRVDGINRIDLRAGLEKGFSDAKLHVLSSSLDGTDTYVSLSQAITNPNFIEGVSAGTTGSGEIDYNATFTRDAIDNELTVYLMDGPTTESILTSQILTDLKDGLNPGLITSTADQFNIKYKPRESFSFDPSQIIVTSSFQQRGSTLNPLSASLIVTPSASIQPLTELPELFVFYDTGAFDDTITVAVTDAIGNSIDSGVPGVSVTYYTASQTKQLNFEFTYTEPITSASVTANKTFFITPDGLPGQDSIVIDIDPNPISLGSNHKGEVYNYALADTDVQITQGDLFLINTGSGNPGTFTTTSVVPTNIVFETLVGDSTTTMSLAGFETMSALSASVKFDFNIFPYFTASLITASKVQKFTKIVDGGGPIEVTLDPIATALNADEIGYVANYSSATTEVFIKQNDEFFFYDELNSGVPGTFVTASISASNIQFSEVSSSFRDLSVSGSLDTAVDIGGEVLHFKGYSGLANNQPSASITYNFKVYPYSLTGGTAGIPRIVSKTQTFSKVSDGVAARKVSLVANSDVVVYNGDGIKVAPEGDVGLTATAINVSGSAFFTFLNSDGSTIQASSTDNTLGTVSDLPQTGSSKTFTVELRDGLVDGAIVDTDSVTISGIGEGSTAFSCQLSNPAASVIVEVDGTTFLQNTGTIIRAYKGGFELQYAEVYDEEAVDPETFLPIGTFGQFSASIHQISSYLTQGTIETGKEIVDTAGELYASASVLTNWNSPQQNATGFIIYKIDFENGRGEQFVQQSFSSVFEGATGPGIVMRGEWTGSLAYIFDQGNQRRDAVLRDVSGTTHYWATTQAVPSGSEYIDGDNVYTIEPQLPSGPPYEEGTIDSNGWEYLGEQELFVAAKIAIFDESFVKNTINVGTPPAGNPNAQIAIAGGTVEPYISVGQTGVQGYGQPGAFIGVSNSNYDLGFGPNSTSGILSLTGTPVGGKYNQLAWDGSTLTIKGAIRQTAEGIVESRNLGLWSAQPAGNQFRVGDIVSNNTITWEAIAVGGTPLPNSHAKGVGNDEPGVGSAYTTYWVESNLASKSVRLSADTQIFRVAQDGSITPSIITLTASRQNIGSSISYTSSPSIVSGSTGDTATITPTTFGANTAVTFTAAAGGFSDDMTIVKLVEGSDGITVVNSNQAHTVPANSDSTLAAGALTDSGTTIEVFEGGNPLDFTTGTAGNGEYTITRTNTGTATLPSPTGNGTETATFGDATTMTTDAVLINYAIAGKRENGTIFTTTTTQTLTKALSGTSGTAGTAGTAGSGGTNGTAGSGGANGTPGTPGAGVVFRGVYDSAKFYFKSTERTDVVKGSDGNYYLVNNVAKTGLDTWVNPITLGQGDWASFGAQFSSVATDILFATDVYADQTINVGASGSNPVIALNADAGNSSANPFISVGQDPQGFTSGGIYLGYDNTQPVLSMVDDTNSSFFTYANGQVKIQDSIIEGTGSQAVIRGPQLKIGRNLEVASEQDLNAYNFTVDTLGTVSASAAFIRGTVNATDGQIGQWVITPSSSLDPLDRGVLQDSDGEVRFNPNSGEIQLWSGSLEYTSTETSLLPVVTVAAASEGAGNRFFVDGFEAPTLNLERGVFRIGKPGFTGYPQTDLQEHSYSLDLSDSSNSGHSFHFTLEPPTTIRDYTDIFNKSTSLSSIEGDQFLIRTSSAAPGSAGAFIKITPSSSFSDSTGAGDGNLVGNTFYYYCVNHDSVSGNPVSMGGEVVLYATNGAQSSTNNYKKIVTLSSQQSLTSTAGLSSTFTWSGGSADFNTWPNKDFNLGASNTTTPLYITEDSVNQNSAASVTLLAENIRLTDITTAPVAVKSSGIPTGTSTISEPTYLPTYEYQVHGGIGAQQGPQRGYRNAIVYLQLVDTGGVVRNSIQVGSVSAYGGKESHSYWMAEDDIFESVVPETEIMLPNGSTKTAGECVVGDEILSWDYINEIFATAAISGIRTRNVDTLYKVTINGHEIEVSENHKFFSFGNETATGQVSANSLYKYQLNNHGRFPTKILKVWTKDGDSIKQGIVTKIEIVNRDTEVITFTVPAFVNYISNNIISHNYAGFGGLTWEEFSDNNSVSETGTQTLGSVSTAANINIQTAGDYYARFKIKLSAGSYESISLGSINTTPTRTYGSFNSDFDHNSYSADVYLNGGYQSSIWGSTITIEKENNFIELNPAGLQVVSSANRFVRIQRKTSTQGSTGLLQVSDGDAIFVANGQVDSANDATMKAIRTEGNICPETDNYWSLGLSGKRWDNVYATNGTIQTSDETQKENIITSDLGLDFINELNPISYTFISGSRTHYGLGAQSVETTLESFEKDSMDFAGLITGSNYGLRYSEFISPMIKAIQELSAKVSQLEAQISGSE